MDKEQLQSLRHSLAHLLAAAVLEIWPDAKRTIGPAVDNGFYYDFEFSSPVTEADLPKIEKKMKQILKTWDKFEREEVTPKQAKEDYHENPYKVELIEEFSGGGQTLTYYKSGQFSDLCRGGHFEGLNKIDPESFSLDRLAGAYWRGDEKNKMLTRIYGLAFESKGALDEYLRLREEAQKRDHKILGPKLDLFMFHPTSPGCPYWLPKGMTLLNELIDFWRREHKKRGYQEIAAPLVNKKELWETSGHWDHYRENMFIADMGEHDIYGVKAMNCPNAMLVFGSKLRSYRDLPLRFSDTDTLHRYELAGTLNGLLRVRSFRQDDSHNYITEDQIEEEYERIFEITKLFYGIFNLEYRYRLGTRPEGFLGDLETWDKAEASLKKILEKSGKEYFIEEGDGAFYGPKIDILMKDALGREWQTGTIQLDFQQPKRFGLEYIAEDGSRKTPVVVHRVIYGSLERFVGLLIEHYAGAFPLWLSPVQISILPISENQAAYAGEVRDRLLAENENLRIEVDARGESIGKKIREAAMQKIPYQIILGQKEVDAGVLSVRTREGQDLGQMAFADFAAKIQTDISEKK